MLRTFTSLSFLYTLVIAILLIYGLVYYRDFVRSARQKKKFPLVFLLISAACFGFLWIHIHAPLNLQSFSNLDHHFIRHDGYLVSRSVELGKTDTANYISHAYNNFTFTKKNGQVAIHSAYSEDPFYVSDGSKYKIASKTYPATGHSISFSLDDLKVIVRSTDEHSYELSINGETYLAQKTIKRGITAWNIFKDEPSFIQSDHYNNVLLINCLQQLYIIRDHVSKKTGGDAKFFLSGRIFRYLTAISYDKQSISNNQLSFETPLADKNHFAWGIGFLDNNKNQYRLQDGRKDSFSLISRYPVSYPLTEEKNNDWSRHSVTKFLVPGSKDMLTIPAVFKEGFLFTSSEQDSMSQFDPVLLTYKKSASDNPLQLNVRWLNKPASAIEIKEDCLLLPAASHGFDWIFSIRNTFNWEFGQGTMTPAKWKSLLFGSLFVFFILVFATSLVIPAGKQSWVWQLLSCITIVLLTTRFFLYWRYKSFPPYEGMDLPSQQQLLSFWNFGVIVAATVGLALVLGSGFLKYLLSFIRNKVSPGYRPDSAVVSIENTSNYFSNLPVVKRYGSKALFFISWLLILAGGGGMAFLRHFDPGTCRHLAIALTVLYFVFLFISYRHSPLVTVAEKSWWRIHTGSSLDILVSNPVKVVLSISLLATFVFIDIGFAIVFLNFLLFNEAFLCINYAIAGLSAGSRRNAALFGATGMLYLLAFILNLLYAPYIFRFVLNLSQSLYLAGYIVFAIVLSYHVTRLLPHFALRRKLITGSLITVVLFIAAFLFFPKEKILDKAAMTKYRIDVMTMPVDKAIETAYDEGKTYEPVIRAAQNQWFINTFIYEENNPAVQSAGFHLLPHAPQNKGAKYNAQATDLVASRFFLAEHGKWSVLLYVLLLILPATLLSIFYKLYPDFTNRINEGYPVITAGFAVLNYLLITALLVILAATGRYIFFGQDMPFGSILSKQSILFPSILIITAILLFRNIPLEYYANRKKLVPGMAVFSILAVLLFFVKPVFNRGKEFNVSGLAKNMDDLIQLKLQPVMDHFDTSTVTRRSGIAKKDKLFTDSLRRMIAEGAFAESNGFFAKEVAAYSRLDLLRHTDQTRMLYLDLYSGRPRLAVNENYFRVEPPPHLQESWTGNVFGDSIFYNISLADITSGTVTSVRIALHSHEKGIALDEHLAVAFNKEGNPELVNTGSKAIHFKCGNEEKDLQPAGSMAMSNPSKLVITDAGSGSEKLLAIEPDAYMKNYYVNGSRFYVYPMEERFIWARNFAESIASEYTQAGQPAKNAVISLDRELMDSLTSKIQYMMHTDTSYKQGAEYGICIADGNGRLIAMADHIKGMDRPDPNDKAGFNSTILGENGFVSQSLLRKQIGNINLLRLNPGPGSTLKPIVFSAIASQLNMDWETFAAEGFSEQQDHFGGQKVAPYDFEKNNGRIASVTDYLKYSDNYYHSNVLLLGSYPRQKPENLLQKSFIRENPGNGLHWPYFTYQGATYWLDGFKNWPGYEKGKVNFGSDSSFTAIGLFSNYGIHTRSADKSFDMFGSGYDSALFMNGYKKSGFILPEYSLFDQQGSNVNRSIPYDVFASCFRGHVKGSSQVMISPAKMTEAFGKMISLNRNYSLTLDPYADADVYAPFAIDNTIVYNNYLSLMRESVFKGLKEVLYTGTAARLGSLLPKDSKYHYYAKTGTTGDNETKTKSKLLVIAISKKDITDPEFNFRNNKFYTIYFTLQNGPAKQNEEFQAAVIRYIEQSDCFKRYMEK
ncbi:MAG: hypothetical protein JNK14_16240 [Chitinophagaceae bacterium]|nr:hypothetical protein [Chitinophagaceae bacterium]